jgi:hypothetical protein
MPESYPTWFRPAHKGLIVFVILAVLPGNAKIPRIWRYNFKGPKKVATGKAKWVTKEVWIDLIFVLK